MIDLEKTYLDTVRQILCEHASEYKAVIFGSRIQGTAKKYSDIDIALIGSNKIDWRKIESIKDIFSESDLPMIVDVIDYNSVSDSFKMRIDDRYELIKNTG